MKTIKIAILLCALPLLANAQNHHWGSEKFSINIESTDGSGFVSRSKFTLREVYPAKTVSISSGGQAFSPTHVFNSSSGSSNSDKPSYSALTWLTQKNESGVMQDEFGFSIGIAECGQFNYLTVLDKGQALTSLPFRNDKCNLIVSIERLSNT